MIKINSKKGMQMFSIILLVISLISLVILGFYVKNMFDNSNYKNSILSCSMTFDKIAGKSAFFDGSKINDNLIKLLFFNCPSKSYEKATINKAVDLVVDCFKKTDKGKNIFVASATGENICLYCGSLEFNQEIKNFNEKFIKEIKKRNNFVFNHLETFNLNKYFLGNKDFLPDNIEDGDVLIVTYYTRYLKSTTKENKGFELDNNLDVKSDGLNIILNNINTELSNYYNDFYNSNSKNVVSGISISKLHKKEIENIDFTSSKDLKFGSNINSKLLVNCGNNLIVPEKNFN